MARLVPPIVDSKTGPKRGHASREHQFFPCIESWRGLAALMVVSAHSWQSPWRDASGHLRNFYVPAVDVDGPVLAAITPYLRIFNNGGGAVAAFFVISGFVLASSLERGPDDLSRNVSRFFLSRVFRIYPAVIATVAIFALVHWATGYGHSSADYSVPCIIQNMLLLSTSINGVMWSLQVELVATFVIVLAFVLHNRWGSAAVLSLTVLLIAASFLGSKMRALGPDLTTLYAFPLGMLAFFHRHLVRRIPPKWSATCFVVSFVVMGSVRLLISYTSNWAAIIEVALAAVVVAYLAYGVLGPIGSLFDHPVIRFYGRISYSLYLLHLLPLILIWSAPDSVGMVVRWGIPTALVAFGLSALTIIVTTPMAWLVYRHVERPGVAAGRHVILWLLRWPAQDAAANRNG